MRPEFFSIAAAEPLASPRSGTAVATRYDGVSMVLHWISALLVISMFTTAWTRGIASTVTGLAVHRSTGLVLWTLTLGRLAWKATRARQPTLPDTMPRWRQLAARASEWLLYGLLLVQPAIGLAMSLCAGKPLPLFGTRLPSLMARDPDWMERLGPVHEGCGLALAGLIGAHALVALHHHVVQRDDVLRTMLPARRRQRRVAR